MNVKIKNILDKDSSFVTLESSLGTFNAIIITNNEEIKIGKQFVVELSIENDIHLNSSLNNKDFILNNRNMVQIRGKIENVDEDGVSFLRLGTDLIMIDFDASNYIGKNICIDVEKIKAYVY